MKYDILVMAVPQTTTGQKAKKYLLAKKELSTTLDDDLIAEFEKIYLPLEQNLLKVNQLLQK